MLRMSVVVVYKEPSRKISVATSCRNVSEDVIQLQEYLASMLKYYSTQGEGISLSHTIFPVNK